MAAPQSPIRRWTIIPAVAAPVALIGGWSIAAARQPGGFSPVHQTISALAAHGAHQRLIMTAGLAGLGGAHLLTAVGLRPARPAGRLLLATGGVSTVLVAVFAQPVHGQSAAHLIFAAAGFGCLTGWPLAAARPGTRGLGVSEGRLATAGLSVLLLAFAISLRAGPVGLTERLLAGAQALWPLVVVLSSRAGSPQAPDRDVPTRRRRIGQFSPRRSAESAS